MKIGDIVPNYPGFDAAAACHHIRYRRGSIARSAAATGDSAARVSARRAMAKASDEAAHAADPYHRARTFLGRRGYVVFAASVNDPKLTGYYVGTVLVPDQAAVVAKARALGWEG